jgi:hypothetical protein
LVMAQAHGRHRGNVWGNVIAQTPRRPVGGLSRPAATTPGLSLRPAGDNIPTYCAPVVAADVLLLLREKCL